MLVYHRGLVSQLAGQVVSFVDHWTLRTASIASGQSYSNQFGSHAVPVLQTEVFHEDVLCLIIFKSIKTLSFWF